MRFMMLVKGDSPTDEKPDEEMIDTMMDYNEELARAGVLKDLSGLHSSSRGARVDFEDGGTSVTKGPFPNPEDTVAGYWIIDVDSLDEAVRWSKKAPFGPGGRIEVRPVFEEEELGEGPAVERARRLDRDLAGR